MSTLPSPEGAWVVLRDALPLSLAGWLEVAVELARLVFDLHEQSPSLLLDGLRPGNIRVRFSSPDGAGVDLRLGAPGADLDPDAARGEAFAHGYTAPELSGRAGASDGPDERTDLYFAGLALYEALAGRPPFSGYTAQEAVHAHLAKRPPPASRLRPASADRVPRVVDSILDRLLAKAPAERYQSAYGLLQDLLIASLARGDRLYGRSAELETGLAACKRETGRPALLVVRGPPGAGKTYLCAELGRRAAAAGLASRVLAGKADQYNRAPFSTWLRAVEALVGQALALPGPAARDWRAAFAAALGARPAPPRPALFPGRPGAGGRAAGRAQELPPLPELPVAEAQERFRAAFCALLRAAAAGPASPASRKRGPDGRAAPPPRPSLPRPPRPAPPRPALVSALTAGRGGQWADGESLALAEHLLGSAALPLLLCVTLRDGEAVDAIAALEFVERASGLHPCAELRAAPLSPGECAALVRDALGSGVPRGEGGDARVAALGAAVHRKTGGNPLHATAFLRALHERRALRFDHRAARWHWSQAEVEAERARPAPRGRHGGGDDAAPPAGSAPGDLALAAAGAPRPLPVHLHSFVGQETQRVLQVASCCGASFDAGTLALIAGLPRPAILERPRPALAAGLVALRDACPAVFVFRHDKIQQASHDSLDARERRAACLRAGLLLFTSCPDPAQLENIFEHPTGAGAAAGGGANALAALRARRCTGYARALDYASLGLAALRMAEAAPPDRPAAASSSEAAAPGETEEAEPLDLASPRSVEFALQVVVAECEHLRGGFEAAAARFEAAWALAASRPQRLRVYRGRVALLSSQGRFRESYEAGVECLAALWGVRIPLDVTMADYEREFEALVAAIFALQARPRLLAEFPAPALLACSARVPRSRMQADAEDRSPTPPPGAAGPAPNPRAGPAALTDVLCSLPDCSDRETLDLLQVAGEAALSAGYAAACAVFGTIPARALRLSLRHGVGPQTAFLCAMIGQFGSVLDRFKPYAFPFAEVSIRFLERDRGMRPRNRVNALLWTSIASVWGVPYSASLAYSAEGMPLAVEAGAMVEAVVNAFVVERLDAYEKRLEAVLGLFAQTRSGLMALVSGPFLAAAHALRGAPDDAGLGPFALPAAGAAAGGGAGRRPLWAELDAAKFEADLASLPMCWASSFYCFAAMVRFFVAGNLPAMWRVAAAYEALGADPIDVRQAVSCEQEISLAMGLALGSRLSPGPAAAGADPEPGPSPLERARLSGRLAFYAGRARVSAEAAPHNFRSWHRLLQAEQERADGAALAALRSYEAARAAAEEAGCRLVALAAGERAAGLAAERLPPPPAAEEEEEAAPPSGATEGELQGGGHGYAEADTASMETGTGTASSLAGPDAGAAAPSLSSLSRPSSSGWPCSSAHSASVSAWQQHGRDAATSSAASGAGSAAGARREVLRSGPTVGPAAAAASHSTTLLQVP
eukprot:tig00020941_g16244.t1